MYDILGLSDVFRRSVKGTDGIRSSSSSLFMEKCSLQLYHHIITHRVCSGHPVYETPPTLSILQVTKQTLPQISLSHQLTC